MPRLLSGIAVLMAAASGSGLAAAALADAGRTPRVAAGDAPALVPLQALAALDALHGQVQPRTPDAIPGWRTCLVAQQRCSAEPCYQFVRRSVPEGAQDVIPQRCDRYPDATPRMIPVR